MLGKYQAIFRSRWRALLWAGGVLLTAYCSIPDATPDDQARPKAPPVPEHHNPWALDKPG